VKAPELTVYPPVKLERAKAELSPRNGYCKLPEAGTAPGLTTKT